MTAFLFLQKFDGGIPVSMPFQPLMDILSRYGTPGRGRGDAEITFSAEGIAASCTVAGNLESGVMCVGFERPGFNGDLRQIVWECMTRLGCAVFDDTLHTVCATLDGLSALPKNLVTACICGARQISSAQQLWPSEFEIGMPGPSRPVLRYTNPNTDGPNFQYFDYAVFENNELYLELHIVPEACNPGTLRILRNLELRIDAALSINPEYCALYRYTNTESPLLVMQSERLGELANHATVISPMFDEEVIKPGFVADREIFAGELAQAAKLTQHAHEKYQLALDGSVASIATLAQLLDKLHTAYLQERNAKQSQAFSSKAATNWALIAGGYLGTVIRQQIGAQWGYITRGQSRMPVVRTHRGRICHTHFLVLDHVINGSGNSIADYFHQLMQSGVSAASREDDLVCNLPGFCQILLGDSHFNSGGGLPLKALIPREQLDFSVNSLRYLDLYLAEVARRLSEFSEQALSNLMLSAGAYLGEVIRSNTADKTFWQWVTYDDYVREQPDFAQKRPRNFGFLAILDSSQQTTYPLAHIAALLGGVEIAPTHAYARQLVCAAGGGELSGIVLDEIDIRQCINSLPADQKNYPNITAPAWVDADPFAKLFERFALLLEHGKPVWARVVQVNAELFESGNTGLPGEIIYDPQGLLSPEQLAPIAKTLFDLRQEQEKLDPGQVEHIAIAQHLDSEISRAFGMSVPKQLSVEPLLLSSVFFERKHLPEKILLLPYFPVLISEKCPGFAMVLPAKWWPQTLLNRVEKLINEKRVAEWKAAWHKLASGRTEKDQEYFQFRIKALTQYARSGGDGQQAVDLAQFGIIPFREDTEPPPFEWEWDLAEDLRSYGEGLLSEVETDRARGLPLNVPRARQSFAAHYFAQMISLHRLLLCRERRLSSEQFKIEPDEIEYAALGLAAGVEEAALKSARMLCLAWQQPGMYTDFIRPEASATFMLFAAHLGLSLPELKPFKPAPKLDALVENERWRTASDNDLRNLLEAACVEHTCLAPNGPFQGLPATILLVLKLRQLAGLPNPSISHELFAQPLALPEKVSIEAAGDALLNSVFKRMKLNGFRGAAIEQAMLTQSPLVVNSSVGAMPLRPDQYQPSIKYIPCETEKADAEENPSRAKSGLISLVVMLLCFSLAWIGAGFLGDTQNRVLLALLAIGVIASFLMGLVNFISLFHTLFLHKR